MDKRERMVYEIRLATEALYDSQDHYRSSKEKNDEEYEKLEAFKQSLYDRLAEKYDAILADKSIANQSSELRHEIDMIFRSYFEANDAISQQHLNDLNKKRERLEQNYRQQSREQEYQLELLHQKLRIIDNE